MMSNLVVQLKSAKARVAVAVSAALVGLAGCGADTTVRSESPDPVVVDYPVAYVARPIPVDEEGDRESESIRRPAEFFPGAQLILKDRASVSAAETILTEGVFDEGALYDVKDLSVSVEGDKLLFAMRAPEIEDADEEDQPKWNLWIYDLELDTLNPVISDSLTAEAGHDIAPRFLPDGRILFSSTRQRTARAILLDEGKPQFTALDEDRQESAFQLHVMNDDGTDIQQLTFNFSHDLDPVVMDDGHIIYTRWDNMGGRNGIHLYRMNMDGSGNEFLYGWHSHNVGTDGDRIEYAMPQQTPDGRLMVMLRRGQNEFTGGELVYLNTTDYTELDTPIADAAPGEAQESATFGEVRTDDGISIGGRLSSAFPLVDGTNRMLLSWSPCRLEQPEDPEAPEGAEPLPQLPCIEENVALEGVTEADPLYGLWIYDIGEGTQQPIVAPEEGMFFTDPVVMQESPRPSFTEGELDSTLVDENAAVIHIRSVYDFDGVDTVGITTLRDPALTTAADRPARFLRVVKGVAMPPDEVVDFPNTAFGRSAGQLMREVIGYAPIEPDGSVKVKVPANVPLAMSIVDGETMRVGERHQQWITLVPGETLECGGCHTSQSTLPHGRGDAQPASANAGAPETGQPFPNTNPALFADIGETMAEVATRINGTPAISADLSYVDIWTDPAVRTPDEEQHWRYTDMSTPAPSGASCFDSWTSLCRLQINYLEHLQPLWELDRQVLDPDTDEVLQDNTCVSCHGIADADGNTQVPAGQLDLRGDISPDEADHVISYRELMFNDNEQEVVDDAIRDVLVQAVDGNGDPLFQTDGNGDLILDDEGNPIPVLVTVTVTPSMNVAGAASSNRFFDPFRAGNSHEGLLNPAELRLIAEWLDIGGQYYNTPFYGTGD
ncbi:hypothetical protein ACFSJ3_18390 [Corallincola platygyrae]|uniref:Hydrazine synthase alpha subunit middle domain-containing protein n=1 Tax=Corallincola platygyrae TaxID=1193278 RepID=A0ABW4XRK1_9GAMM